MAESGAWLPAGGQGSLRLCESDPFVGLLAEDHSQEFSLVLSPVGVIEDLSGRRLDLLISRLGHVRVVIDKSQLFLSVP